MKRIKNKITHPENRISLFGVIFGVFRRGNKPPVLLGEDKKSRATIKSGEASAKPQRNIGKN